MTKNLTLKLDEHLISKAKQKAIGEGTSLSQVVADFLKKFCRQESDIEEAPTQVPVPGTCNCCCK